MYIKRLSLILFSIFFPTSCAQNDSRALSFLHPERRIEIERWVKDVMFFTDDFYCSADFLSFSDEDLQARVVSFLVKTTRSPNILNYRDWETK